MNDDTKQLIAFLGTLTSIVLLSKIGGTGADLAIMTGLIGVLGMLARPPRDKAPEDRRVTIDQPANDPTPVEPRDGH